MAVDANSVNGLAESFIETISKLNAKERDKPVSRRYAEELNKLIELAKEVAPEHDARMWPAPVRIQETMGVTQVFASYADLETAARQIAHLVPRPIFLGVL